MTTAPRPEIRHYGPDDRQAFADLNREWLLASGLFESIDEWELAHPVEAFIDTGGAILVADLRGEQVGVCALRPFESDALEIAKLAVATRMRGCGVGKRLVLRCIDYARRASKERLVLTSNSELVPAVRLYRSLGFSFAPLPAEIAGKYRTADLFMELALSGASTELLTGLDAR